MKYQNAKFLLPPGLFRQLQRYIQGGYLYVPAPEKEHKRWGELSGYREELERRNRQIASEAKAGASLDALAQKYFLSVSAIRKIVYRGGK